MAAGVYCGESISKVGAGICCADTMQEICVSMCRVETMYLVGSDECVGYREGGYC